MEGFVLHRAAWVAPVNRPPIANGAVLVQGAGIVAVGPYKEIKAVSPSSAERVDQGEAALMPGLVNAHTHLELSALKNRIALPQKNFASWLDEILSFRSSLTPEIMNRGLDAGERELTAWGTCLCGDITNGVEVQCRREGSFLQRHTFIEVLGFNMYSLETALEPAVFNVLHSLRKKGISISLAAHSCYSTSAELIMQAKAWCRKAGLVFSMHVAEHEDEVRFLQTGAGYCRDLLLGLGRWVPEWRPPRMSPIRYLDHLGVLDERTLLVHAVYLDEADWEIVEKRNCVVCFCLRSNRNLSTGRADVEQCVKRGIRAVLGTDSLAGNTDLNLFAEAAYMLKEYPMLPPDSIMTMMTLGGAETLQGEALYGSIEPGKKAKLLTVDLAVSTPESRLAETIISQGERGAFRWASHPNCN